MRRLYFIFYTIIVGAGIGWSQPSLGATDIKVVSYNIQGGCTAPMDEGKYDLNGTINALKKLNADVILLQEVGSSGTSKGTCNISDNQSTKIPELLGMTGYYSSRLLILIKKDFSFVEKNSYSFSNQDNTGTNRAYLRAKIRTNTNQEFVIYNTHAARFDKQVRQKQIDQLHNKAKIDVIANVPTSVGGDFNECAAYPAELFQDLFRTNVPSSITFTPLAPKNKQTWEVLQNSSGCNTLGSSSINERIDYIFFDNKNWTPQTGEVAVSTGNASDHYAIVSTATLNSSAAPVVATTDVPTLLTDEKIQSLLQKPVPKIKIPGLSFSDISIEGLKKQDDGGGFYLNTPFIGEYLAAIYRYLVVIGGIVSVAMIVVGGFQYAVPDPSGESKSEAKNRIIHAVTGLIITLSSYVILYTINPELVAFKNLKVFYVRGSGEGTAEHFVETIQSQTTAGFTPVPCSGKKAQPSEAIIGVADFVRSEPYSCGDRDLSTVKWVVLHEGGRKDTIGFLTKKGLSTHFEVKRDGTIVQAVDIRRRAGHAGSVANPWSVGIDLQISDGCADQSGKCVNSKECSAKCDYTDAQYESVNQIINVLTQKTGIKKDDEHIIAHCQIKYPSSNGHGDPRNFDWTKIGLNPDKHRQNQNYVNGRCVKSYDSSVYGPLMKGALDKKPVKKETVGCCSFTVNNQPDQADMTRADCEKNPQSYDFSEEKCTK